MTSIILYLLLHLACAFVSYGYMLAGIIGEVERKCGSPLGPELVWVARLFSAAGSLLFGPIALIATIWTILEDLPHRYGFRLY